MFDAAGDAENALAGLADLGPDRAAHPGAMNDAMGNAAQRDHRARLKWCGLRQAAKTCRDPRAVALREILCLGERAARRHREDGLAVARMDSERVAPRAAVSAQPYREKLRSMGDQEGLGVVGPPIEE